MLNSSYLLTCAFIKQINITQKGSLSHTYKAPRTHTLTHRWALPKAQAKGGMSSSSEPKSCKKNRTFNGYCDIMPDFYQEPNTRFSVYSFRRMRAYASINNSLCVCVRVG